MNLINYKIIMIDKVYISLMSDLGFEYSDKTKLYYKIYNRYPFNLQVKRNDDVFKVYVSDRTVTNTKSIQELKEIIFTMTGYKTK